MILVRPFIAQTQGACWEGPGGSAVAPCLLLVESLSAPVHILSTYTQYIYLVHTAASLET